MIGQATPLTPRASAHLDMIRGLAALAVLTAHMRGLFFIDYTSVAVKSPFVSLFYLVTGFQQEPVMIFFVLSGFFIGGSVMGTLRRWSWARYLVNRLSRLYLVLLPALLLAALLDYIAYRQPAGPHFFDFPINHFTDGPIPGRDSLEMFLGNVLFLGDIKIPTFGSAMPLKTVNAEFWYYILFPCMALALYSQTTLRRRIVCLLLTLAMLSWLPGFILRGFLVWLMGAAVDFFPSVAVGRNRRWGLLTLAGGVFVAALGLSRIQRLGTSPFPVPLVFTLWLYCLTKLKGGSVDIAPAYKWLSRLLSKCSYSVYAVHFPIALLMRASFGVTLLAPTFGNMMLGACGGFAVFLCGLLFSRMTEAHTDAVRAWLLRLTGLSPTSRMAAAAAST